MEDPDGHLAAANFGERPVAAVNCGPGCPAHRRRRVASAGAEASFRLRPQTADCAPRERRKPRRVGARARGCRQPRKLEPLSRSSVRPLACFFRDCRTWKTPDQKCRTPGCPALSRVLVRRTAPLRVSTQEPTGIARSASSRRLSRALHLDTHDAAHRCPADDLPRAGRGMGKPNIENPRPSRPKGGSRGVVEVQGYSRSFHPPRWSSPCRSQPLRRKRDDHFPVAAAIRQLVVHQGDVAGQRVGANPVGVGNVVVALGGADGTLFLRTFAHVPACSSRPVGGRQYPGQGAR